MRVGSLFSGIGGMDLGLERAGMRVAWQVEKDEWCRRVLAYHWPNVRQYGDIHDLDFRDLEGVDLVAGGFPCQPFSVAGRRAGTRDDRYLWPRMLEVIRHVRPAWVLGENVAGIVNLALDRVLSDLEAQGYACRTFNIPACAIDAPHERKRIWIVANRERPRLEKREGVTRDDVQERPAAERGGRVGAVAHADGELLYRSRSGPPSRGEELTDAGSAGFWSDHAWIVGGDGKARRVKPGLCGLAHGVPGRVAKLRGFGNAVVPQVVEVIGRAIMAAHLQESA